ncbi:MAG: cupredoxin family copper-binding protein [Dehalococcoidia bacterium]|nr:cupredoxin family copper-binding protein [Dehalococcoidia bacterium]
MVLTAATGISCRPDEPEPEPEFDIAIEGFAYEPAEITISVGATLTWLNRDLDVHTVTAQDGTFDSGNLARGDTFSYTFEEPGTFEYYCIPHPYMTGRVIVG